MSRRFFISATAAVCLFAAAVVSVLSEPDAPGSFVNWESPHVHPLDITPDATRLLAVNTANNRLLVYALTDSLPALVAAIPVGLDPVSVRPRGNEEAWVVNQEGRLRHDTAVKLERLRISS